MSPLSKISSRFSEMGKREKITFGILIVGGLLLVYYLLILAPLTRSLTERREELDKKKNDLATQGRLIKGVPDREQDRKNWTETLSRLKKMFLLEEQASEFLKELESRTNSFNFNSCPLSIMLSIDHTDI